MLKKILNAIAAADDLNQSMGGAPIQEERMAQLKTWASGIFRLVVIGEIKKGKSSFINALLGEKELVPTNADVATSTVFKIHYAKDKLYRVFFAPNSHKEPLTINEADLPLFGTEKGNPGNEKQVSFIEVGCPSPLLKSGIVIFDTPGLGGLLKEHRRITYECMPKSDAVFFVTDSVESPIGKLETDYLHDIQGITQHIYFVQTKSCAVDSTARILRKKNNLAILADCLKRSEEQLPYFIVDSRLRFEADETKDIEDLKDSGYPALLAFVQNELQKNQQKLLLERMRVVAAPLLQELEQRICTKKEILNADSTEARKQLEAELTQKQDELRAWQETGQPNMLDEVQRKLRELNNDAIDLCDRNKPMGEFHLKLLDEVNAAQSLDSLRDILQRVEVELPDAASRCMNHVSNELRDGAARILSSLGDRETSLSVVHDNGGMAIPVTILGRTQENLTSCTTFDSLRNSALGGTVGLNLGAVVGGIIGSIIPGIGNAIGATIGGIIGGFWGGRCSVSSLNEKVLDTAKQKASASLGQVVSALYSEQLKTVRRIIDDLNAQVSKAIHTFTAQRSKELARAVKELNERGNMQNSELVKRQRLLAEAQASFAKIQHEIIASL